jgi:hypothetical protein
MTHKTVVGPSLIISHNKHNVGRLSQSSAFCNKQGTDHDEDEESILGLGYHVMAWPLQAGCR